MPIILSSLRIVTGRLRLTGLVILYRGYLFVQLGLLALLILLKLLLRFGIIAEYVVRLAK